MDIKLYEVKLESGGYIWAGSDDEERRRKAIEECRAARSLLDSVGWPTCDIDPNETHHLRFTRNDTQIVSRDRYIHILESGVKLSLVQVIVAEVDPAEVFQRVSEAYSKGMELTVSGGNTYNNKCEVHMPGNMLATYNQVQLLEDSCTDKLQESLSMGWRIIAVCPQPDSRRPDYILGRFNPENFDTVSADRC